MIKVLIVDDHELVRVGIKRLLGDIAGIQIVGDVGSGEEAIKVTKTLNPDVILMDVKMPGIDGLETTKRVLRNPGVKVIAVTVCKEDPFPMRLLQAGAHGYLTKDSSVVEMVDAIRKVYAGQRYLNPEIAQQLALRNLDDSKQESPFEILSERELQVLLMITKGESVNTIAEKLCLSTKTIHTYRFRIFEKLAVDNDVELTHLAIRHGLVDRDLVTTEQ